MAQKKKRIKSFKYSKFKKKKKGKTTSQYLTQQLKGVGLDKQAFK